MFFLASENKKKSYCESELDSESWIFKINPSFIQTAFIEQTFLNFIHQNEIEWDNFQFSD